MKYAGYHVAGSKANEFKAESQKFFGDSEFVQSLQSAMINLDRTTMSFDLDTRNAHQEVINLATKFGVGLNSFE